MIAALGTQLEQRALDRTHRRLRDTAVGQGKFFCPFTDSTSIARGRRSSSSIASLSATWSDGQHAFLTSLRFISRQKQRSISVTVVRTGCPDPANPIIAQETS